jgi:hypothetical protein
VGVRAGAGTVLTVEQAEAAISAGAQFVISPGVNPEVVSYCVAREVPVFPGVATPTDIQAALNLGGGCSAHRCCCRRCCPSAAAVPPVISSPPHSTLLLVLMK